MGVTEIECSTTSIDIENSTTSRPSWFKIVFYPAIITPEVQNYGYPGSGTAEDPYVISWLAGPGDPGNPKHFPAARRWLLAVLASIACFSTLFASSAYTGGIDGIATDLGASTTMAQAGVSLFVLGFAVGPLLWAPLSEIYGRQPIFIGTFGVLIIFNALSASARSFIPLLVFRALSGIISSSPLSNAGALIADIFGAEDRSLALGLFSFGPYLGPVMGPIVSGYLGASPGGWRAVLWLCTGLCGLMWVACSLLTPETYAPVLLAKRAAALSKNTGRVYVSQLDHGTVPPSLLSVLWTGLSRPWALLFLEPIVLIMSIFMAVVDATMYMLFASYPIIFQQGRGWSAGTSGLAFIPMVIGLLIALFYMVFYENARYKERAARYPGGQAPPEARLPVCIVGGILVLGGLFWFSWTNSPSMHWIVCLLGTAVFSIGNVLLYLAAMNYLVDSYVVYTASCMAATSIIRSILGATFPLLVGTMYSNLGIHWASSIPAFIALACFPFLFLFAKYGSKLRARCRYSSRAKAMLEKIEPELSA